MSVTRVREGDTKALFWVLTDKATNAPMDLTGAAIVIHAQGASGPPFTMSAAPVAPATAGRVTHVQTGTLAVGTYRLEYEVDIAGEQITAPTIGAETLVVLPRIGDTA